VGERAGASVAAAGLVAALGAVVGGSGPAALAVWRAPWFWRAACVGVYAFAVAGAVSCIIRTPPWYGVGRDGKPVLFSPSGEQQYVLEGAAVGALNLIAGCSVIGLVALAKSRRRSELAKVLLGTLCAAAFGLAYARIVGYYAEKQRWYSVAALVPAGWSWRATWRAIGAAGAAARRTALAAGVPPALLSLPPGMARAGAALAAGGQQLLAQVQAAAATAAGVALSYIESLGGA
jgi:hypothetical protein